MQKIYPLVPPLAALVLLVVLLSGCGLLTNRPTGDGSLNLRTIEMLGIILKEVQRFNRCVAKEEFERIGGAGDSPVEDNGVLGTDCTHWDEDTERLLPPASTLDDDGRVHPPAHLNSVHGEPESGRSHDH